MKKIVLVFMAVGMLFAFNTTNAQTEPRDALTIQGGYSWTMGMVGVSYQMNYLELGGGVMPSTMPGSG